MALYRKARLSRTVTDEPRGAAVPGTNLLASSRVGSEIEFQAELYVSRVAGASEASEVAGTDRQGRVAEVPQRIVRSIEDIEEVSLEGQAHVFSGQFEGLTQGEVGDENVRAGEGAHAAGSRIYGRGSRKGKGIKELVRVGWVERYSGNPVRAARYAGAPGRVTDLTTVWRTREDGDRWSRLRAGDATQLPAAQSSAEQAA